VTEHELERLEASSVWKDKGFMESFYLQKNRPQSTELQSAVAAHQPMYQSHGINPLYDLDPTSNPQPASSLEPVLHVVAPSSACL